MPHYDRRTWLMGIGAGLAASVPVVAVLYWFLRPAAIVLDWPVDERSGSALKIDGRTVTPPPGNPISIRISNGRHRIVVLRRGYEPIEWKLNVGLGQRIKRQVDWKPVDVNQPLDFSRDE